MNMAKDTRRIFWLDLLRIISVFSVIALHAAAVGYEGKFCAGSDNWQWCNIYGSVTRFCVPVLVMISGVMLLNPEKDYSIKKIFFHKIFHLAAAFILWIIFYSTVWQLELHQPLNWKKYLTTGPHHFWFLFMISGLYLITPILRVITANKNMLFYFLLLAFIFVFCINTLALVPLFKPGLTFLRDRLDIKFTAGYISYFITGYWLANHHLDRRFRLCIYELGILSLICTVAINGLMTIEQGKPVTILCDHFLINTFFISVAIFTFLQYGNSAVSVSPWLHQIISIFAKLSFGVYLVHIFYLERLKFIGLPDFFIHPALSIPITSIVTYALSFLTVCVISKIPVLRKYAI